METRLNIPWYRPGVPALTLVVALAALLIPGLALAQAPAAQTAPEKAALAAGPPVGGGFFPLSEVHRGLTGTAWTVFTGTTQEPMEVEILGVLRGARGPGHDMILAQLHGAKPEYTGVVAGMSGSPVYIGNRLLGSLSYRIGQFTKDPIAGITPIEQMLEVRDLPFDSGQLSVVSDQLPRRLTDESMQAMETPLVMSGFRPEAIRLWQEKMAGTGLEMVAAGGMGGSANSDGESTGAMGMAPSSAAIASIGPGSAVSALLVRGDLEIAATCTVTYVDAKQLLACGHPIMQAGPVSLPMTTAEVVATVASPLNAFKIVNTGATIGAFNEDRDAAIRGVFGAQARMIPVHIRVEDEGGDQGRDQGKERKLNVEVLDQPSLTPQAVLVSLYESLLESNDSTAATSYHLTGSIGLTGYPSSPLNLWAPAGELGTAPMQLAVLAGEQFARLYSNGTRQGAVSAVNLDVEAIPRHVEVELEGARLVSSDMVHAGDTVVVEATVRPWHQAGRNVRIAVKLPARLGAGNLRLLVSDAGTLDRVLDQPRQPTHAPEIETALAQARSQHAADRIYVSLLTPETQAFLEGQTLTSLPLSVANALEPRRAAQDASLNGESAELEADASADGVLSGFQVLNLRIESGGGVN
ncbi:MAG: SpoIVB peptidase S55 [Terracidiphilus sp.]